MDDGLKIRRSTRDIKRPKFDDELVQSVTVIPPKPVFKKRERNFQSPDYSDLATDDLTPGSVKTTGGKKKPARQSLDKSIGHEKVVYRERIDSQASAVKEPQEEKLANVPDRKRKERIQVASKATAQQKNAIKAEADNNSSTAQIQLSEAFRRWAVQDDVLLISSVTHVCDLNTVHSSTKFSKPFTLGDIDLRWYSFIYDTEFNRAVMQRIEQQLTPEQILKVQSTIPFSIEEEQILAEQPMVVNPTKGTFENLLTQHRSVFHHARTPEILEQHWASMKHWGLLADQTIQNFDDELMRLEREYDMNRFGVDDVLLPTDVEDRNFMRELQNTNQEVEEWERVLTRAVTGINHVIQFDKDTMAVLKGRCVSFDIRKDRVLIGRSTQKHKVDVNLSYEGPTASISRRQGLLRIEPTGRCFLYNLGEANVFIDRRPIRKNSRGELHTNSIIEIGSIRLLFARNEEMFYYRKIENSPEVNKVESNEAGTSSTL
ncbi:FHA domain-containing protein [Aphelenchoides bicaudatus]|nr:FHA domain-containing protein [Aphelenchoides bicaudatus]